MKVENYLTEEYQLLSQESLQCGFASYNYHVRFQHALYAKGFETFIDRLE